MMGNRYIILTSGEMGRVFFFVFSTAVVLVNVVWVRIKYVISLSRVPVKFHSFLGLDG
ncbi:MAG: hypothetical protein ACI9DM_002897 [Cyclobacteriaceae bacterium]|jgi:hypothetical protein